MDKEINLLSGIEFENLCQELLEKMGFETETTKTSGDGGIDLIAYNHQPLLSGKYIIQCKRYSGSVGEPIIRDLYGVVASERANKGIIMTTGYFTKSAIAFADGKQIELIDGERMNTLLSQYNCINDDISRGNEEYSLLEENYLYTIEEIFENNPFDIDYYNNLVNELSLDYNDKRCARLVIYIISEWGIMNFDEKISIIPTINKYIELYLDQKKENEKCKWLSFLFMMCYIQFSILSGKFNDAKTMLHKLMQNKELLFTGDEFLKSNYTTDICEEHLGIFNCLYDTLYNMIQLCNIVKDEEFKECINQKYCFNIVKVIARSAWEYSIENIDFNRQYAELSLICWNEELEALSNIYEVNRIYLISDFELEMYYDYAYKNVPVGSLSPNSYSMEILRNFSLTEEYSDWYLSFKYKDGKEFGKLYNLSSKIDKYNAEKNTAI